jgi:hypothetical protein
MTERYLPAIPEEEEFALEEMDFTDLLPEEKPLRLGPSDDENYREAQKLPKNEILENAEELRTNHALRIAQSREYSLFMDTTNPAYFTEDEQLIKDQIMEVFPILGEREDYEFRCGFLANHTPIPKMLNRDALDRSEAMALEDLVIYDFACEERQYQRTWHADLRWAEVHHLQRFGMLVGFDAINPKDTYCGLDMQLVDPLTVYPVFGGPEGLSEVYRIFEATNEEIIGTYGGDPGFPEWERIRRKVHQHAAKTEVGTRKRVERGELRTVTEYWNRDWLQVILDDEHILLERKHGERELPFTIVIGAFDQPMGVQIGSVKQPYDQDTDWGTVHISDASVDLARQMRPYRWRHIMANRISEAVAGRRLSMFKWSIYPHVVREYDPNTDWQLSEKIELTPGEHTDVPIPGKLNIITPVIDPNVMAGLAADLQSNVGGGYATKMRLGTIPPQTSGSAMTKLAVDGGAPESVLVRTLATFKQLRAERRLRLRLSYGDSIGKPLGTYSIPASDPRRSRTPMHAVTPDMIERAGTQLEIDLFHFQPDVMTAQYTTTIRAPSPVTGKPLISDDTARRILKAVPDPDREGDRIDDEALKQLPPIQQRRHLARLQREYAEAEQIGDMESMEEIDACIEELEFLYQMAIASGQAAPLEGGMEGGPQGAQSPMMPQMAEPAMPTPALPGTSLPEQGIGVGQEGGRPMGAAGPPQPMQPISGGGGLP